MTYVELHARSAFSFLEGASQPEALVERAAALGYPALALVDTDGLYGAVRFHQAATEAGLRPLVGAALTVADGTRLPLLAETVDGYRRLCRLLTRMKFRAAKGKARVRWDDFAGETAGLVCLTGGGDDGPLAADLAAGHRDAARATLERLVELFGRGQVYVELQRHGTRESELRTRRLLALARSLGLPVVATNGVTYANPAERLVLDVFTALRHKTTLDAAGRRLPPNLERWLKPPAEMARLFADQPAALAATAELADRCAFTLRDLGYRFPDYPVPGGDPPAAYLRALTEAGARERYRPITERVRRQLARELDLIETLDLAGYFLIVWDIVRECRTRGILVQGRGSAANSAVCYSLGITAVDPVGMDLLFERFLSEERREWPDIDLDLPSGDRREAIIQYVYGRYGRTGAAMTANIITYRARRAAREVGKVLGFPPELLDRLSKHVSDWEYQDPADTPARYLARAGLDPTHPRVGRFAELWARVQGLPRHLGQHSGGLVLCAGRLDDVVPLEPATMPGRTVVQWDKDDCADLGLVKVDLLGLGMMAVLEDALVLCRQTGQEVDLAHLPADDPEVYAALQEADTVGVFQVESRAQMATLPRLRPERFYDVVVQIAIIRPGPIVGNMVHPYLARRAGRAPVSYPHPSLEPILARTLGVPLFQEQLLRMAMVAAGFTGGEAEELRRALGFRRSEARMRAVEAKLRAGIARNGIGGAAAEEIVRSITSFAEYGFPESHAASFALLAYASAYLKVHHPGPFYAALLNNQPMGFYHPATLVKDAQRHGLEVRPVDVTRSDWPSTVEDRALRLGLMTVKGFREAAGRRLVEARRARRFDSVDDLAARAALAREELVTLAEVGALAPLGLTRRGALWEAARAARPPGPLWAGRRGGPEPSPLREMTAEERVAADYRGMALTVGPHPLALRRAELAALGVTPAATLGRLPDGTPVRVAGAVIVRQRPGTAKGFVFLSLEDETGIANAIVRPALFDRERALLVHEPFLLVEGQLQHQDGVISVRAAALRGLPPLPTRVPSHDFR